MARGENPVLRPAVPADIPVMAQTVVEGFQTYLHFAPPGWSATPLRTEIEFLEHWLTQDGSWAAVAEVPVGGEPRAGPGGRRRTGGSRDAAQRLAGRAGPWPGRLPGAAVRAAAVVGHGRRRRVARRGGCCRPRARIRGAAPQHPRGPGAGAPGFYEREGWTLDRGPRFDQAFGLEMVVYVRGV